MLTQNYYENQKAIDTTAFYNTFVNMCLQWVPSNLVEKSWQQVIRLNFILIISCLIALNFFVQKFTASSGNLVCKYKIKKCLGFPRPMTSECLEFVWV